MHMFASRVLPALNTVHEDTETCAVCVCECVWVSFLSSEHLKAFSSVPPLLPRTESWALTSYQQRPLPSLHPSTSPPPRPPPPFFPYWCAWKGSTARSRSSGGSLLNCLLSVGSGTVGWGEMGGGGGLKSREKVAILVSLIPKIKKNKTKIGATLFYILFFYKCILCIYSQITCELWMYIAFTFLRLETAPL